jgi:hypothetical protein
MEHDQQRLELHLFSSAHYISSCESLVLHPLLLPARYWVLPIVQYFHLVSNSLNLLGNLANHSYDLLLNQQNQGSKYGSEPRFVSHIVYIIIQEHRDGLWCYLVPGT